MKRIYRILPPALFFLFFTCSDYDLFGPHEGEIRERDGDHGDDDGTSQEGDDDDSGEPNWADCTEGYQGEYFNLPADHPDVEGEITGVVQGDSPFDHNWYDPIYHSFTRHDPDLNFGNEFWPVDEGLEGDPQYFSVHWSSLFRVYTSGDIYFDLGSDDDSWVFIDGEMYADLGGIHGLETTQFTLYLEQGGHELDIYFAERHTSESGFYFQFVGDNVVAYLPDCGSG